jgi:hypothetical protein
METTITKARACKTSAELFVMAESLSQAISDSEAGLERAELDYNWDAISHYVGLVAHWKYLYKTIYGWASDMEEEEHEIQLSAEIDAEMMGDRI